jgi:hypothetical protein
MSGRNDRLKPGEWEKLKAEWVRDSGLRRMEDRGVKYEDEAERKLDHAGARGGTQGQATVTPSGRAEKPAMAGKLPVGKDEPAGTYQVWHRDGEAFRHVANVEAGNTMAAVVLPLFRRGAPGTERVAWLVDPARPTTYGDKIVGPLGAAYELYKTDFGGTALRETSMAEAKPSASRDVTPSAVPALPFPGEQPPHPWPSEIAEANRHQPGKDNGNGHENSHDAGHSM